MKNFNKFFAISLFSFASFSLVTAPTNSKSQLEEATKIEAEAKAKAAAEAAEAEAKAKAAEAEALKKASETTPKEDAKTRTWSEFGSASWTNIKSTVAYPFVKINAGCNAANEYVLGKVNTESNCVVNAFRGYSAQTIVVATVVTGMFFGYKYATQPAKKQANKNS